jgi:hypothetical protein
MYNRSTIIRKKRKLDCGCFDYAFSKNKCKAHATIESTNRRIEAHEDAEETESLQNLVEDLDAVLSRYIRLKYADGNGLVPCYTCNRKLPIAQIQNGHFIHRADMATRFLEDNCRPQCPACNQAHNDDNTPYRTRLEREKPGITTWLEEQARQVVRPTRDELRESLINYRWKVKTLESKLKKHTP